MSTAKNVIYFQINKDSGSSYEVPVEITGSEEARIKAKEIIDGIINQDGFSQEGRGSGRREGGGGGFDRGGGFNSGGGFTQRNNSEEVTKFNINKSDVGKIIGNSLL